MDAQENTHAEASAASDAPPSTTAPQTPGEAAESRRLAFERHFAAILGAPAVGGATLDAAFAAERALEVVAIARGEAVAEKLALLPDALFPRDEVARLEALAHATLYADELAGRQSAGEDKVADQLLEEADQIRATLHKLLDYHYGDDAAVSAELAELRARRGAFRVAATLARLATLAREREATLAKDAKYWRDDLIAEAERLAQVVQGQIGGLSEKDATELKRKAFGLLEGAYAEVKAAIQFVTRHHAPAIEVPALKRPAVRKPRGEASPAS